MGMLICNLQLMFDLPEVVSLKQRRTYIQSIKAKLKEFNVSVLDVSGSYAKEAVLAVVFLAHDQKGVAKFIHAIEGMLQRLFPEIEYELDYEVI